MWSTVLLAMLLVAQTGAPAPQAGRPQRGRPSPLEGTWEYVGDLKGQAMITGGRFVFVYGPSNGSGPMTGDAGTYQIAHDTASAKVTYSTDAARVGVSLRWAITGWSADTAAYVVWNESGQEAGRGRAVRVR